MKLLKKTLEKLGELRKLPAMARYLLLFPFALHARLRLRRGWRDGLPPCGGAGPAQGA